MQLLMCDLEVIANNVLSGRLGKVIDKNTQSRAILIVHVPVRQ